MKDIDRDGTDIYTGPSAAAAPGAPRRQRPQKRRIEPFVRCRKSFPEFSDAEVPGQGDEPIEVVRVGMGEDEVIDAGDALAPQDRGDDPLPDVERARGEPAPVDDHGPAARQFDEEGFALSDIDHGDPEVRRARPERRKNEQGRKDQKGTEDDRSLEADARPEEAETERQIVAEENARRRRRNADGEKGEG